MGRIFSTLPPSGGRAKSETKGMRTQFAMLTEHSPIEFVTGRVKSVASIIDKAEKRNVPLDRLREDMQDIAGLRMMCQFVDEIKPVVEYLRKRNDFEIVEERDYVTQRKIAVIVLIMLSLVILFKRFKVNKSIGRNQIRTLAMNFWATIEHSLNYKYSGRFPEDIKIRLQRAAEAAFY